MAPILPPCTPSMDECNRKVLIGGQVADPASGCSCYIGGQLTQEGCYVDEEDVVQCPGGGSAGGQGTFTQIVNVGPGPGVVPFYYQAYSIPDRFVVGGSASFDSGVTSGDGTVFIPKNDSGSYIQVTVIAPIEGTAWIYNVGCTS